MNFYNADASGCLLALKFLHPVLGSQNRQQEANTSALPAATMIVFDHSLKTDAVGAKIRSFSLELANAADTSVMALTESEAAPRGVLDRLLAR